MANRFGAYGFSPEVTIIMEHMGTDVVVYTDAAINRQWGAHAGQEKKSVEGPDSDS